MLGERLRTGRTICTRECPSAQRLQGRDALQGNSSHLVGMVVSWGWGMHGRGGMQDLGTSSSAQGVTSAVVFRSQLRGIAPQTGLVGTFQGLAAEPTLGSNGSSCVVLVFCKQLNFSLCQHYCSYNVMTISGSAMFDDQYLISRG